MITAGAVVIRINPTIHNHIPNVAVLRDMLHFRDNPSLCSGLFDTGEIDAAIRCICTE